MAKLRRTHNALFGNVSILRGYCYDCQSRAFVIDGDLQCCGKTFKKLLVPIVEIERVSIPVLMRKLPGLAERNEILQRQEYSCFYCDRRLGSWVDGRKQKQVKLRLHWDHWVPFSYNQDNRGDNFVAACHQCNARKSNLMFQTVEEARVYLQNEIYKKASSSHKEM